MGPEILRLKVPYVELHFTPSMAVRGADQLHYGGPKSAGALLELLLLLYATDEQGRPVWWECVQSAWKWNYLLSQQSLVRERSATFIPLMADTFPLKSVVSQSRALDRPNYMQYSEGTTQLSLMSVCGVSSPACGSHCRRGRARTFVTISGDAPLPLLGLFKSVVGTLYSSIGQQAAKVSPLRQGCATKRA